MASQSARYDLRLKPRLSISRQLVGEEQEPVLVVDGLMESPQALIDYAAREVSFAPVYTPTGGYPGIRAPAPTNYVAAVVRALDEPIRRAFGLEGVRLARADCTFSLITLPSDRLAPLQRIPHVDTADPLQFALLHYLCDAGFGGTGFYRHRATGYETLDGVRRRHYETIREGELKEAPPAYIVGDSDHYERIGEVEARPDRLVAYRSCLLHSGDVVAPERLSDDPRTGRLTANIFVTYRPV